MLAKEVMADSYRVSPSAMLPCIKAIDFELVVQFSGQWHNEVLICQDQVLGVRSVKGWAKRSAGVTTGNYDALTMSAGQDNVGEIILAVLSMRRLKNKFRKSYEGGIVFVDEIDATLYPAAQVKLIETEKEKKSEFQKMLR